MVQLFCCQGEKVRLKKLGLYIETSGWQVKNSINFPRCLVYTKLHSLISESLQKNDWMSCFSAVCSGVIQPLLPLLPPKVQALKSTEKQWPISRKWLKLLTGEEFVCILILWYFQRVHDSIRSSNKESEMRHTCFPTVAGVHLDIYHRACGWAGSACTAEAEFRRNEFPKASVIFV